MTLRLILVRHAKSSWKEPALSDHERPLNKRGRASAKAVGDWLRRKGYAPDTVLSSTSERTRETHALMETKAPAEFDRSLYLSSAKNMLKALQGASGDTVMMLGHNPGTGEFAERLARKLPSHERFLDYPTCATTVLEFEADSWNEVSFGTGNVKAFVVPRELT
jgi:phosphohistidine phosphatase